MPAAPGLRYLLRLVGVGLQFWQEAPAWIGAFQPAAYAYYVRPTLSVDHGSILCEGWVCLSWHKLEA